jgi:hypothetical protein
MRSVLLVLDCGRLTEPTAATVDQIARFRMATRRRGCTLHIKDARPSLIELIDLFGLAGVLGVETRRQAEQRKDPRRVEEECEFGDPAL